MKKFLPALFIVWSLLTFTSLIAQQSTTIHIGVMDSSARPATFRCRIDSMKAGESLVYAWTTNGCYHRYSDSIVVFRTNSGLTVKHNGKEKKMMMSEADILRDFEYNIFKISKTSGGCTTSESYFFVFRGRRMAAGRDITCRYHFFTSLLEDLKI